jgi:hypothetical protein
MQQHQIIKANKNNAEIQKIADDPKIVVNDWYNINTIIAGLNN